MGRTACEKLFKIDDGVGCNCVPQSYAVSKVSSLKQDHSRTPFAYP